MDSLIAAAARALAHGDALGALKHVALREDPPALALRGIAMAQFGEHLLARDLLRRAARAFGAREELARARCIVAEAEVALAMRDLRGAPRALAAAITTLEAHSDRANALHAQLIGVRRLLLLGRVDEAASALPRMDNDVLPSPLRATAELVTAEVALRSLHTDAAVAALSRAKEAADMARVPALIAEVAEARATLDRPAARRLHAGATQLLRLQEVEALLASDAFIIDGCRHRLGTGTAWCSLARRPVLFSLARALGQAWPGEIDRDALIADAFRTRHPDASHRARLRVEIGRLRALIAPWAQVSASAKGFVLTPADNRSLIVLAPPIEGALGSLAALLADGTAWSTSALAQALGTSQRTIQRALVKLESTGQVRSIGDARAQRWLSAPLTGFTTNLLLPAVGPPW